MVIASGARLKRLGIPGEAELEEKGVSHCADCDGPFYQGQDVVVVGGGDSALQEAIVLAEFARTVHLVHRGAEFRAAKHFVDRIKALANVAPHMQTEVEAVLGEDAVRGVRVKGAGEIPCTGFFAYVGLEPASEFVPASIKNDGGYVITDPDMKAVMPGVFAAGAVRSGYGGLLVHAMAEGIAAAKAAHAFLR